MSFSRILHIFFVTVSRAPSVCLNFSQQRAAPQFPLRIASWENNVHQQHAQKSIRFNTHAVWFVTIPVWTWATLKSWLEWVFNMDWGHTITLYCILLFNYVSIYTLGCMYGHSECMWMQGVHEQISLKPDRWPGIPKASDLLNSDLASCKAAFALCLYLNNRKQINFNFYKAEVNQ